MFDLFLTRWDLTPDGEPIVTPSSRLLPVRHRGAPAMLKIAVEAEEKSGGALMRWWDGIGAARVLAHEDDALLLERAMGAASLAAMARNGHDDDACRMICRVVAELHRPRSRPMPALVPLATWFRALEPVAATQGGIFSRCAEMARALLSEPQDVTVLHGDIHHGNILDFGERGWLAIDPKGLYGERGFDYANLFCNPDHETALTPGRLARRAVIVSEAAGMERRRLLQWVLAYAGLSAAWVVGDGQAPDGPLAVAREAAAEFEA